METLAFAYRAAVGLICLVAAFFLVLEVVFPFVRTVVVVLGNPLGALLLLVTLVVCFTQMGKRSNPKPSKES